MRAKGTDYKAPLTHHRVTPGKVKAPANLRTQTRRLDLVVNGLGVERGLPLFCDVTCVSPVSARGFARPGTSTIDGALLRDAARDNDDTCSEALRTGLGKLLCLGCEVFGRWSGDAVRTVQAMAAEKARGLPAVVRRGAAQSHAARWWGLLTVATQQCVARAVLREAGADLATTLLEDPPGYADLPVG